MKFTRLTVLTLLFLSFGWHVAAQDDLLDLLEKETQNDEVVNYTFATFKANRVINGQSVETTSGGELNFIIGHRFGKINDGFNEFFGLDQATIRLGFEYGLMDNLNIGIGRSSFQKTYDGYIKYKLLRQSTGAKKMPVTLTLFSGISVNGQEDLVPDQPELFTSRLGYSFQALLARKFNNSFSLQLSPTLIHKNLVEEANDNNDFYALGVGTRYKLSNRVSLNLEYFHRFNNTEDPAFYNSMAVGFDIETGGHIFQLQVTNSKGMIERYFVTETTGDVTKGDIFFGFNINRVFTLKKEK